MLGHPDPPPHLQLGVDAPEDFWQPRLADRFGIRPWDMPRLRIDHLDRMMVYLQENPRITL